VSIDAAAQSKETADATPGHLHVFLGTAVGVGKTYAMLNEGTHRTQEGEDVVIGYLEGHGRAGTRAQRHDLENVSPRVETYRGTTFEDLDVVAVTRRCPDVVLVDELAHSRITDGRSRWEDVEDIRHAGIDVISTLNVANLRTVREYAAEVTGAGLVETVPDEVLGGARVDLVDLPPDVLRRRVADGYVYSAERVGGALANYFRSDNLAALSELGRAWMAGTLEEEGPAIVERYTNTGPRPVVVAGVSGRDGSKAVVRRATELAESGDADLVLVHVLGATGPGRPSGAVIDLQALAHSLGASYQTIRSEDAVDGLAVAAQDHGARTVVVARHRSRWTDLLRGSVARRLRRHLPQMTVEIVEHD
jgi:two-component system sensor histidine kinase KdpD